MDTTQEAVTNGLAIVSIPVKEQERSKRFYNEVLGFPATREADSGRTQNVELNIPGTKTNIALVACSRACRQAACAGWCF
jgi:catechol 2,3-dioxygenase-like lactoylglutathione lyase family enzyme